jgi:small redox-active disulfide protein 2
MKTIEIVGPGCKNCKKLEENSRKAAEELQIEYEVKKISEIDDIVNSGVMRTPGLIIDGKVVSSGRIPSVSQIKELLES